MITEQQIEAFERDGAVTIDTPLTDRQLAAASDLTDRLLPLSADERNPPGVKPQRYRIGRSYPLEAPFVRIIEEPFFELLAKRLMHTDSVVMTSTSLKNTHPQPGAEFEIGEHTDMTLGLADLGAKVMGGQYKEKQDHTRVTVKFNDQDEKQICRSALIDIEDNFKPNAVCNGGRLWRLGFGSEQALGPEVGLVVTFEAHCNQRRRDRKRH